MRLVVGLTATIFGEMPTGIVAITLAGVWGEVGVEDDDELPQPHSDHNRNSTGNAPIVLMRSLIWRSHGQGHLVCRY